MVDTLINAAAHGMNRPEVVHAKGGGIAIGREGGMYESRVTGPRARGTDVPSYGA